jgi:hypothetical protein
MQYSAIMTVLQSRYTYFLVIGIGGLIGARFIQLDKEERAIRDTYKPVTCTITDSAVAVEENVHHGRRGARYVSRTYYPDITYEYEVDGEKYEGDTYRAFEQGMTEEEAVAIAEKYDEGKTTRCYYNPANPEEAVLTLESDTRSLYTTAALAVGFLVFGVVGWIVVDFVVPRVEHASKLARQTPEAAPELEIPGWSSLPRPKAAEGTPTLDR